MSDKKPIGTRVTSFNPGVTIKPFKNEKVIDTKDALVNRGDNVTHGDVIIIKADESDLPSNFDQLPDAPMGLLALGEHTGHAHALMLDVLEEDIFAYDQTNRPTFELINGLKDKVQRSFQVKISGEEMFLKIEGEPYLLKHQEHYAFRIHPGTYEIGIQQETDLFSKKIRSVLD